MKLSEIKALLPNLEQVRFALANGEAVPAHFHVTEVGQVEKRFIDCGGTMRNEKVINFQLWTADDYDHRLSAQKLAGILELSERKLGLEDLEIEVEFQQETIGKYGLAFVDGTFVLEATYTDCLAKDSCGIPSQKPKIRLSIGASQESSCAPGSGCC